MAPDLPPHFVPRPTEFGALKKLLLSEGPGQAVAITIAVTGTGLRQDHARRRALPRGLKPILSIPLSGTTEVVLIHGAPREGQKLKREARD